MLEASDFEVVSPNREGVGVEALATVRIGGISTRDRIRVDAWEPERHLGIAHLGWVGGRGRPAAVAARPPSGRGSTGARSSSRRGASSAHSAYVCSGRSSRASCGVICACSGTSSGRPPTAATLRDHEIGRPRPCSPSPSSSLARARVDAGGDRVRERVVRHHAVPRTRERLRPASFSIPLETGATFEDAVRIYNLTDEPLRLAVYATDAQAALDDTISVGLREEHPEGVGKWIDLSLQEPRARAARREDGDVPREGAGRPIRSPSSARSSSRTSTAGSRRTRRSDLYILVRTVPPNTQTSSKRVRTFLVQSPWVAIALLGLVVAGALVWVGARRARRPRDRVVQPGALDASETSDAPEASRPVIRRLGTSASEAPQSRTSVLDRVRASAGAARRRDERPLLDDALLVEVDERRRRPIRERRRARRRDRRRGAGSTGAGEPSEGRTRRGRPRGAQAQARSRTSEGEAEGGRPDEARRASVGRVRSGAPAAKPKPRPAGQGGESKADEGQGQGETQTEGQAHGGQELHPAEGPVALEQRAGC